MDLGKLIRTRFAAILLMSFLLTGLGMMSLIPTA